MLSHGGNSQPLIDKEEHRYKNIGGKAVVVHGYDTTTDSYYPINVSQNADGTYSLKASAFIAVKDYDSITVTQTSPTVETYVYKKAAAATVRTVTVTYTDSTRSLLASVGYA